MSRTIDARLRVLYLVAIAVGVFLVKPLWALGALVASQAIAWLALGIGPRKLVRQVLKLWGFTLVILVSYAITKENPAVDRWVRVAMGPVAFSINMGGVGEGAKFLLRVLAIILGSQVARAGDPRSIAAGLAALHAPRSFTLGLDAVLALLGGDGGHGGGRGGGKGRGDGRGRGRGQGEGQGQGAKEGLIAAAKRVAKGDVEPIRDRIAHHIARVEAHIAVDGKAPEGSRDVATMAGIALTMLGIRALKILPSINFAPGHKLVLLTPLYIGASILTRSRFGATVTGLLMGLTAFLLGDGKYGVFELLKHVAPGLVCDLVVPFMMAGGKPAGRFAWSVLGGVTGAVRFAAIFLAAFIYAPAAAIAFLVPGFLIHTTFGVVSGYVSLPLAQILAPLAPKLDSAADDSGRAEDATVKETV